MRLRKLSVDRLTALSRTLGVFSYERTLERGYTVIRDGSGAIVAEAASLPTDGQVEIQFQGDVRVPAQTSGAASPAPTKPAAPARKKPAKSTKSAQDDNQGSLF